MFDIAQAIAANLLYVVLIYSPSRSFRACPRRHMLRADVGMVSDTGAIGQPDPSVYPRYCGFSTYARLPSIHEVYDKHVLVQQYATTLPSWHVHFKPFIISVAALTF